MTSTNTWLDRLANSLISAAARRAPPELAERLEEEWQAELAERHGALSRLRLALGCCWATRVISLDHARAIPAVSTSAGPASGLSYPSWDTRRSGRRTSTLLLVLGFHAAVLYVLIVSVTTLHRQAVPPLTITPPVPAPRPEPQPTVDFSPTLGPTRLYVPPLAPVDAPPEQLIREVSPPPPSGTGEPPPRDPPRPIRVPGGPGRGFPNTDDFYPAQSIRAGEHGIATVSVCVDGTGRLTSEPAVAQSSGVARLDDASLRLARAGTGHYRATTEGGRGVSDCYAFRVRFDLKN